MLIIEDSVADPRKNSRKTKAIVVAAIVHLVLIVLFLIIAVFPPVKDEPEIVAAVIREVAPRTPRRATRHADRHRIVSIIKCDPLRR